MNISQPRAETPRRSSILQAWGNMEMFRSGDRGLSPMAIKDYSAFPRLDPPFLPLRLSTPTFPQTQISRSARVYLPKTEY